MHIAAPLVVVIAVEAMIASQAATAPALIQPIA
jgi:hypothetical protein